MLYGDPASSGDSCRLEPSTSTQPSTPGNRNALPRLSPTLSENVIVPSSSPPAFPVTADPHSARARSLSPTTKGDREEDGKISYADWDVDGSNGDTSWDWKEWRRERRDLRDEYGELEGVGSDGDGDVVIPMLESRENGAYPPILSPSLPSGQSSPGRRKLGVAGRRRWVRWPKNSTSSWINLGALLGVLSLMAILMSVGTTFIDEVKEYREEKGSAEVLKGDTTGGDGSTIITEEGTRFVYKNRYGGTWDSSATGSLARAQLFTPPLSTPWDYAKLKINGVNLGGWLTLEPFITPSLYEPFMNSPTPAEDEWSLSVNLGSRLADVLEDHYRTFITEQDFAQIADAGLSWVRIPLPFWAVDPQDGEPFLGYVAWKYFLKAVQWARKYGLRINLDLHTVPGSQNGWNHSGKLGASNFLNGVMGVANAQRTLNVIRLLTEFIVLPGNLEVIPMFGVVNEPNAGEISVQAIRRFYYKAYSMIRNTTGIGQGNGPMLSFHDAFVNPILWYGFMDGADRISLDSHFYLAFASPNQDSMADQATKPCTKWASKFRATMSKFGLATAGEWSLAVNDCGLFVNGVDGGSRYHDAFYNDIDVAPCDSWTDTSDWTEEKKMGFQKFAYAYMDTTRNWFFWTWKTGVSLSTGKEANPMWSYSRGLREGYMPLDPRRSSGFCHDNAINHGLTPPRQSQWEGTFQPWQTGGSPTATVKPDQIEQWGDFPGPSLAELAVEYLPTFTATGSPLTFPATLASPKSPTATPAPRSNDWYVPVSGCEYPGAWEGVGAPVPTARCTG